ncbi:pentapeptide repeat-containing protein [Leptothoe sp. PORK10 BA2]|uniref:pentapeptide repeat-containing protein n=1 Tax=Leptothoe sp. PORK10 BA2 TaxID=3110254 RepID=UPI002B20FFB9|nr:pentapeptide repeat-containing protein [Leptothoe sp. PORK10 BA2]MEA5466767.1 pentapeptide repeat-containing protein [Leptothoe sp. PORK10 BA2]
MLTGFVREVQDKVSLFNHRKTRLQVLMSGREVAVQESFRDPCQILHVLPYFVPEGNREEENGEPYVDPKELLIHDQRDDWWQKYSAATQGSHGSLPPELNQGNLTEITAQPLLNYLVALSYVQGKLTVSDETNLNTVYADLLNSVYERGYDDNRRHQAIGDMEKGQFIRVLEEIALAAWHGDGRTTTVKEIEDHCESAGLRKLLEIFEQGAAAGVTRLLAAFYFRQSGRIRSHEKTFEFTHKSFGEYLTACRIVRAMERIQKKLDQRQEDMEEGWDELAALKYWAEVCGPTRMDSYLLNFLRDEVALKDTKTVATWQTSFSNLIGVMLRQGMPMERIIQPSLRFHEANQWAINSEEALLAALNACALKTQRLSTIKWPTPEAFGTWIRRLQGQRTGPDNVVALLSLSFLDLSKVVLHFIDLYGASLGGASLGGASLVGASLDRARLDGASLDGASLDGARLGWASLDGARLDGASLDRASLDGASLVGARLIGAHLDGASLVGASLVGARLVGARLDGASLDRARLDGASLDGAHLDGASLVGANFKKTNFQDINWDTDTDWSNVSGLDKAFNVPKSLRQQLANQHDASNNGMEKETNE